MSQQQQQQQQRGPVPAPGAEPMQLTRACPACSTPTYAMALLTRFPGWDRDVAATRHQCHACNHVSTRYTVGVAPTHTQGQRTVLHVRHPRDLDRDVLKSEHAVLAVPALGLQLPGATMAGTLCSVRELLAFVRGDVAGNYARAMGEAAENGGEDQEAQLAALGAFLDKLTRVLSLEATGDEDQVEKDWFVADGVVAADSPLTIEISDPAGNSYIAPMGDDVALDTARTIEDFERTAEMVAMLEELLAVE
ncbi:ZPR1 zinc-finger domain-containing protein [Blastocladiella britannica]|nr:ZPR1 zinc-finger domain-containing protein [Blastocladiella britannica]